MLKSRRGAFNVVSNKGFIKTLYIFVSVQLSVLSTAHDSLSLLCITKCFVAKYI